MENLVYPYLEVDEKAWLPTTHWLTFQVFQKKFVRCKTARVEAWILSYRMVFFSPHASWWMEIQIGVEPKIGGKPPKWMVKIMENPIKLDDLGGPPLFLETSIYILSFFSNPKSN